MNVFDDLNWRLWIWIITCFFTICAVVLNHISEHIGKREHVRSFRSAARWGGLVASSYGIGNFIFSGLITPWLLTQMVALLLIAIIAGYIYVRSTEVQPSYVTLLPEKLKNEPVKADSKLIRDRINAWDRGERDSIPLLGDKIEQIEANYEDGYVAVFRALFETRQFKTIRDLNNSTIQLTGRPNKKKKWDYKFKDIPRGFQSYQGIIEFTDTRRMETEVCLSCAGEGSGTKLCSSCDGRGGSYERVNRPNKTMINGEYAEIDNYVQEYITCSTCSGSGEVSWTCSTCGGAGSFSYTTVEALICERGFDVQKKGVSSIKNDLFGNLILTSGKTLLAKTEPSVHKIDLEAFTKQHVNMVEFQNAVAELKPAEPKLGSRFIGEQFSIWTVSVSEIAYQYDGERYDLWIYGNDNRIHAPSFPLNHAQRWSGRFNKAAFVCLILCMCMTAFMSAWEGALIKTFLDFNGPNIAGGLNEKVYQGDNSSYTLRFPAEWKYVGGCPQIEMHCVFIEDQDGIFSLSIIEGDLKDRPLEDRNIKTVVDSIIENFPAAGVELISRDSITIGDGGNGERIRIYINGEDYFSERLVFIPEGQNISVEISIFTPSEFLPELEQVADNVFDSISFEEQTRLWSFSER